MNEHSIAVARWLADRHRFGEIIYVEVEPGSAGAASVDERGVSLNRIGLQGPIDNESADAIHLICDWICRVRAEADTALIVGGGVGPSLAARIARGAEFTRVLIPDCAGRMAEIGTQLSPEPIVAELTIPPTALDTDLLRESATRAMEALSEKLARSGYDFDDVICETLAGISRSESDRLLWVRVGPTTRAEDLVQGPRALSLQRETEQKKWMLCAVRAVARVDTRHWELPDEHERIAIRIADEKEIRRFQADGAIIERSELAIGTVLNGPMTIRATDHFTAVPLGWTATACRAGGIRLEYNGPAGVSLP